jgi:HAD superfamily hydrolase (TIGR01509 family)
MNHPAAPATARPLRIDALLFDLDGTLIDSMPIHGETWRMLHEDHGLAFEPDGFFHATAGRALAEIIAEVLSHLPPDEQARAGELKEARYREIATRQLQMIAGFPRVHAAARGLGLQMAIGTAAPRANIRVAQERFPLLAQMDTVVSPADGLRGKPHPDIFLEAARRLGVPPARCLVFEDAPLGVMAARNAGMHAVALTTELAGADFASHDNLIGHMDDFTRLDLRATLEHLIVSENDHAA